MSGPLYLAWRYLAHHRAKTAILVTAITLIAFLPIGLNQLVSESGRQLAARAQSTPLLVGERGSRLDLVLASLYFASDPPAAMRYAEAERVNASELATAIPLHVRFRARGHPVVGTQLEYLEFRGLQVAAGRPMAVLGECLVGASAARSLGLAPGDTITTSPETVFDLAGTYPLRMRVTGVLAPSHTPDDEAIFVDVKTAWVIEGLGHGHQDVASPGAASAVLKREEDRVTANASLVEYNEITPENLASFHFHGDLAEHPVSAVLAVPRNEKSRVLLLGRYTAPDEAVQIVEPAAVMDDLLATVFTVRRYVLAAIGLVSAATLVVAGLVFLLSVRLRRREIETLHKLGAARSHVALMLAAEVVAVLVTAGALAGLLTFLSGSLGGAAIRAFLLS